MLIFVFLVMLLLPAAQAQDQRSAQRVLDWLDYRDAYTQRQTERVNEDITDWHRKDMWRRTPLPGERDSVPLLRDAQTAAEAAELGGKAASSVSTWLEVIQSYESFRDAYDTLSDVDKACQPDFSPAGSPMMPTACEEYDVGSGGDGCGQCYEDAVNKLDFTRFYLEKLRCIAHETLTGANAAMKFGDNASGVHGVSGLAWQLGGKPQIEEAVKEFRKTYDRKYQEYMRMLQKSLNSMSACEAQYMNNPDWYSRYGFVYYSFMEDRYRSPD
jgi:hypothetical protein